MIRRRFFTSTAQTKSQFSLTLVNGTKPKTTRGLFYGASTPTTGSFQSCGKWLKCGTMTAIMAFRFTTKLKPLLPPHNPRQTMNRTGQISHQINARRVRKPFSLPSGATGFTNDSGQWVCTGSQMGRRDTLPASAHPKLRLRPLPFVCGCYDRWGAYWGAPADLWIAWDDEGTQLFRRGDTRESVKAMLKAEYPQASFYR